jgi:pimeloyl-ACP methyl ester carboxylesterase
MRHVLSPAGNTVSYEVWGSGPPLVLVHGSLSDQRSNWKSIKPFIQQSFTAYAIARRGRGETEATEGHSLEDEGRDVAAVIRAVGEPLFLLGHSYGAQVALVAAAEVPDSVRKLVLYEPPWPHIIHAEILDRLERLAGAGDWTGVTKTFFRDVLLVPAAELEGSALQTAVSDARATLGDLRAINRYDFRPERFKTLRIPVVMQVGTESPRELFATDALTAVLPDVSIQELPGKSHEAMITAPQLYADAVSRVLLD